MTDWWRTYTFLGLLILILTFQNCTPYEGTTSLTQSETDQESELKDPIDTFEPDPSEPEPDPQPDPEPEVEPDQPPITCLESAPQPCSSKSESCTDRINFDSETVKVWRTHDLTKSYCEIKHIIVVIHGTGRTADSYFSSMNDSVKTGKKERQTLVVAPRFVTSEDDIESTDLFWSSSGWKEGNTSNNNSKNISSFSVIDELVSKIKKLYPNTKISMIGHSAGGQFVHRYAAGGNHNDLYFYVANPSSYLYLNEYRVKSGSKTSFELYNNSSCNSFNDYKYGLDARNSYMAAKSRDVQIANLVKSKMTYLLGTDDNQQDEDLATGCAADLQGEHRLERGQIYKRYLDQFFPENNHRIILVEGVGHTAGGMFRAPEAVEALH